MAHGSWLEEFPGAITVCDTRGIILEMNTRAAQVFQEQGGKALIGKNLLDCHPDEKDTGDGSCVIQNGRAVILGNLPKLARRDRSMQMPRQGFTDKDPLLPVRVHRIVGSQYDGAVNVRNRGSAHVRVSRHDRSTTTRCRAAPSATPRSAAWA